MAPVPVHLLFGVLAAAAAFSLVLVLDATLRRAVEDRVTERIEREIDHLAQDMAGIAPQEMDAIFRRSARELGCRITLILPDGRVSNDTDLLPAEVPADGEPRAAGRRSCEARRSGRGESRRVIARPSTKTVFYFARLLPDGNVLRLSVGEAQCPGARKRLSLVGARRDGPRVPSPLRHRRGRFAAILGTDRAS